MHEAQCPARQSIFEPEIRILAIALLFANLDLRFYSILWAFSLSRMSNESLTTSKLAQTSVALINLTYNLNDGVDWNGTYTTHGIVNATNLSCYFHNNDSCPQQIEVQHGLAHAYGESPSITTVGHYNQIEDIYQSTDNPGYYCRTTREECAYRFAEYNPDYLRNRYPHLTKRVITASTGECSTYTEIKDSVRHNNCGLEFKITNGLVNDSITIPDQLGSPNGTTYIYRGFLTPGEATEFACGDRCIWMWAHKSVGHGENSTFYRCPISISNVTNIEVGQKETQDVPRGVARLAAAAIALQGRQAEPPYMQYQFFPFG